MYSNFFPSKIVSFMGQCGKYDGAEQYTNDNVLRNLHFSCRITTARIQ